MITFEKYYSQIMSKGNLNNPTRLEAAKDLDRMYNLILTS